MEKIAAESVPNLRAGQMREVDRLLSEKFGIKLIQLMESAGRNLAHLARERFFDGDPTGKRVILLAGTGGNGGGALVAARRLHNWGAEVQVGLTRPVADYRGVPARHVGILQRMNVPIVALPEPGDLILDGIIGYSLRGAPRGTYADRIDWANDQEAPILALDLPSGVDASEGTVHTPAIRATATLALGLPKVGLKGAAEQVGELYLADIGIPPALYAKLDLEVGSYFARGDIVRLT